MTEKTITLQDVKRDFIYHSPQYPGHTCWCGLWNMPDGSIMLSFTQATGPLTGRPKVPDDVAQKLEWPPAELGEPYDMTGLDMQNIHLRSADYGRTWDMVSGDHFASCIHVGCGEAELALPDGTIIRGVLGFYLPYDDVPRTSYVQRSLDGSHTWSGPEVICNDDGLTFWVKRIRQLNDGRLVAAGGLVRGNVYGDPPASWMYAIEPALFVSDEHGRNWIGPIQVVPDDQKGQFSGEEFDFAELDNGDLLLVIRTLTLPGFHTNDLGQDRRQTRMVKRGDTWEPTTITLAPFAVSGHPELLKTSEGAVLHVATSAISCTVDEGRSWQDLEMPPGLLLKEPALHPFTKIMSNWPTCHYYSKAIQMANGEILCVGHVGADDGYGAVDQSIIGLRFRIQTQPFGT